MPKSLFDDIKKKIGSTVTVESVQWRIRGSLGIDDFGQFTVKASDNIWCWFTADEVIEHYKDYIEIE